MPNYSSPHSTLSNKSILKRLYIVTGKGGVGKSTLSLALTKYLNNINEKAKYISFDQSPNTELCHKLDIPFLIIEQVESTNSYVSNKLGSAILAKWLVKTPFFVSMLNMLPSLGHIIFMGHIIHLLEADPELRLVIDFPSSGHAITMFQASHNFKEIFGNGKIVDDINRMHEFISQANTVKVLICNVASIMALNEGVELKKSLNDLQLKDINLVVNDSFFKIPDLPLKELPEFLKKKVKIEKNVCQDFEEHISAIIPHHMSLQQHIIVEQIIHQMENII